MIQFPITHLMDEQKCYEFLVEILHPNGFGCPRCHLPVNAIRVHRKDRAPLLYYRCSCGRVFNAFTGTEWQGAHHSCSTIVRILQGVAQGTPTAHLAKELKIDRTRLLQRRHKLQKHAVDAQPTEPLPDSVVEADELFQNAGEKRFAT